MFEFLKTLGLRQRRIQPEKTEQPEKINQFKILIQNYNEDESKNGLLFKTKFLVVNLIKKTEKE